mmetsp:Transcript_9386/g.25142  ORF Transcript_9386/g.25142 Transcript_9386/m.25142 type:complete len:264 (+) Transcript_9386:535-1326(+)
MYAPGMNTSRVPSCRSDSSISANSTSRPPSSSSSSSDESSYVSAASACSSVAASTRSLERYFTRSAFSASFGSSRPAASATLSSSMPSCSARSRSCGSSSPRSSSVIRSTRYLCAVMRLTSASFGSLAPTASSTLSSSRPRSKARARSCAGSNPCSSFSRRSNSRSSFDVSLAFRMSFKPSMQAALSGSRRSPCWKASSAASKLSRQRLAPPTRAHPLTNSGSSWVHWIASARASSKLPRCLCTSERFDQWMWSSGSSSMHSE